LGGIDLSIVAIANTSGIFAAMILSGRWLPGLGGAAAIWVAAAAAMLSSAAFGLFNGFWWPGSPRRP
jgi:simple sugar transport system permease protein